MHDNNVIERIAKNYGLSVEAASVLAALYDESWNNGHDFGVQDCVEWPKGITGKSCSGYMSVLSRMNLVEVYDNSKDRIPDQYVIDEKVIEYLKPILG